MTTLFQRIKNSFFADMHDMLDKKEQKNPIALLNQHLRECKNEVKKVARLIDRHHQLKQEFYREWKQAEHMAKKRKEQSEIAEQANETKLQQMAQQEQAQYEERATRLKGSYDEVIEQLEELEQKHREMKLKIKDMDTRRMELMGKENVIRVKNRMNQVLQHQSLEHSTKFEEIEDYIHNLEHRLNHGYERDMLDYRISQLKNKQAVK